MPVKLTEDMVVARSKGSDLHNIRKLNCWGSELCDVSVVRKLPNVEVLSLSVNQLTGLADFQWCQNLQELYIRKNNIKDINELLYLRQLPKLKSLWLADNPCAQFSNYRLTVLRNLPHLQKLDNVAVEGEEVQQAMTSGLLLPLGQDRTASQDTRSSDGGGGEGSGSVSDYSPPASLRAQRQSQNGYSSPERECSSSVSHGRKTLYDEEDENRTSPTRPVQRQSPQAQESAGILSDLPPHGSKLTNGKVQMRRHSRNGEDRMPPRPLSTPLSQSHLNTINEERLQCLSPIPNGLPRLPNGTFYSNGVDDSPSISPRHMMVSPVQSHQSYGSNCMSPEPMMSNKSGSNLSLMKYYFTKSSVRRSPESTQYTSSAAQRASPQQYSSDERASTPMRRVSQPVRASPQSSGYYQSPPRRASHAGTPSGDYEPPSSQGSAGGEAYESRPQYAQEASSQAMSPRDRGYESSGLPANAYGTLGKRKQKQTHSFPYQPNVRKRLPTVGGENYQQLKSPDSLQDDSSVGREGGPQLNREAHMLYLKQLRDEQLMKLSGRREEDDELQSFVEQRAGIVKKNEQRRHILTESQERLYDQPEMQEAPVKSALKNAQDKYLLQDRYIKEMEIMKSKQKRIDDAFQSSPNNIHPQQKNISPLISRASTSSPSLLSQVSSGKVGGGNMTPSGRDRHATGPPTSRSVQNFGAPQPRILSPPPLFSNMQQQQQQQQQQHHQQQQQHFDFTFDQQGSHIIVSNNPPHSSRLSPSTLSPGNVMNAKNSAKNIPQNCDDQTGQTYLSPSCERSSKTLLSPVEQQCLQTKFNNNNEIKNYPTPLPRSTSSPGFQNQSMTNLNNNDPNLVIEDDRQVPREQQPQYRSQEWGSDDPNDNYVRPQQQQQPMQRPPASGVPPQRGYTRQQYAALVQQRAGENINVSSLMQQHYDSAYRRLDTQVEAASLRSGAEGARPYHARPKTRSGNVLSAVLCLIKELDYTGLEVAEMAIRCRMDELDD